MKFIATLSALSAVYLVNGQTASYCDGASTDLLHEAVLNAVNKARNTSGTKDHKNALKLVSELSQVAAWQVEATNWAACDSELVNYGFLAGSGVAHDCCPVAGHGDTAQCTIKLLAAQTPSITESVPSYVGALDLAGIPLVLETAASQMESILAAEPFLFLTGGAGDNVRSPNPDTAAPEAINLGVGISTNGDRLVLILGDAVSTGTYTSCVTTAPTETIPSTLGFVNRQLQTDDAGLTGSTDGGLTGPTDGGANNLCVGFMASAVAAVAYLYL